MKSVVRRRKCYGALVAGLAGLTLPLCARADGWDGYAGDPQHTAVSAVASQALQAIHWETPVDLAPQLSGDELLIHYGSPSITAGNTVIVPVKTGATGGFEMEGINGATGAVKWTQTTDYTLPPMGQGATYSWTPSYSGVIAGGTTLYYPGAGGTVYERSGLNANGSVTPTQLAFYGSLSNYQANAAAYNAGVAISTPITADAQGDIYFGFQTSDSAPGGLTNGLARISAGGVGTFFEASSLQVNGLAAGMTQVQTNCAPAISPDGSTVYVTMSTGNGGSGRLVALNSATLVPKNSVALLDGKTGGGGGNAPILNISTASPMIGPDGDVYMGVFDAAGTSRGWMDHFSADLTITKPTGGFGWDDTASVVPASMVPSYKGTSKYLIMTKYNNYVEGGGDGKNMLAILDPNDTQVDTRANSTGAGGATIMKQILTITGPTADDDFPGVPGAVREWCINTAVVDPATDSILVNNEDGSLYRWNLTTDTLTEEIALTAGLGEAYTPTLIGPDGTVYAINDATLFAVGAVPEPATLGVLGVGVLGILWRRKGRG